MFTKHSKLSRLLCLLLTLCMVISMVTACSSSSSDEDSSEEESTESEESSEEESEEESSEEESSEDEDVTVVVDESSNSVTMVIAYDIGDVAPYAGDSIGHHVTYRMIYDCLFAGVGLGATLDELESSIGKSYTLISDYEVEIEIYDYVTDSQGNAITASDVVFSYEEALASGTLEKLTSYFESIEAIDDYTVDIKLSSASIGAMEYVMTMVPIVSQEWYENSTDEEKSTNPAGTGAYTVVETVADSHTTLALNEDYWQTDESLRSSYASTTFDTITISLISESSMRTIALENGEADIVMNVSADDLATFLNDDGTAADGWNVYANENGRFTCLMFNNDNSVFADNVALRQAVLYAIDFEAVRLGYGETESSGSTCSTFGCDIAGYFNEAWLEEDYYDYDLDKALELMEEAGYPDGGLTITLMYQNDTAATSGLTVLQAYLAEIGITVELTPYDQALFNTYKYDDTMWDIIIDSKEANYITAAWENVFDTNAFENGSACFTHDETLQELLETAASLETTSEEAIDAFHYYLKEMAYGVGLFQNYQYYVAQDGITEIVQDDKGNITASLLSIADDYVSVAE